MHDPCSFAHQHDALVEEVAKTLPPGGDVAQMAMLFKAFSDPTRLTILCALLHCEMCVFAIAKLLGVSQSAVSHQLRTLKAAGLVVGRKEGKTVIYSPADDHVRTIIAQGLEHVLEPGQKF